MNKQLISALVVENSSLKESTVAVLLEKYVDIIYHCNNGNEALKLFSKHNPEIIITEINLPDINGYDLINKIKRKSNYARIVIVTSFVESKYFLQAIEYGVKGFLIKPVSKDKFNTIIKQVINEIILEKTLKEQEDKRKEAESALKHGDEIMRSVSFAAEQFLKFNYGDKSINNVLKRLGQSANVSRVYIFQNAIDKKGEIYTNQQFEWTAKGITKQINNEELQGVYFNESGFGRWINTLNKGKPIYGKVKDFPESEHEALNSQHIKSLAIVPIFVYTNWWGFIGFDECEYEREWTEGEINALMAAADIMGAAIHRKKVEVELLKLNNELESRINQRTVDLQSEIMERSQIEQMLRESEEKYRQIFENANDGILLSVNGLVKFINPKLFEMTGYLPKDTIGKNFTDFLHPDYKNMVMENHMRRLKGENVEERYDIKFINKKGEDRWFELKANLISWEGEQGVLTFLTDITERKENAEKLRKLNRNLEQRVKEELEKIKRQQHLLIQKSKLESLGELAAGMAHEINQPLGSISMGLDNIMYKYSKDELSEDYINRKFDSLFQDISRIRNIIEHIRIFSRDQQAEKFEKVSVNDVIYNALSLITSQYKNHNILLSIETTEEDCYTIGNKYKLEQVVLNLLSNAKFAVDEKLNSIENSDYQKMITIKSSVNDGNTFITIEDNGIGISEKIRDNIFDPFFTTKKAEVGTGLGLSIIYGIIKEMKGEIKVESEVNVFTRMIISAPLYKS